MKYLRMALLPTLALALAACADVSPVSPRSVRDGTPNPNKATTKPTFAITQKS